MGQVVAYLVSHAQGRIPLRLISIDPRGPGSILWSPAYLTVSVLRVIGGALTGRLALVHIHVAERASLARKGIVAWVARALGVPVLLHLHAGDITPFYDRLPRFGQFLARGVFRRADLCVVLGAGWRDWLVGTIGVAPDAVVVLRNGVPYRPEPSPERIADAVFRVLFLGNLIPFKGAGDLLDALADPVLGAYRLEATFAGGGDIERYRRQAAALGLGARVRFTGWVDRAQAEILIATADVLVLPSFHEGLPLVILEALAAGTPVVCTPVGGIPEVLHDERTALFVPPGGKAEIAHALCRLINDSALRTRLSEAGQALYHAEFTMDVFIDRIASLYQRCTAIKMQNERESRLRKTF